MQELLFQVEKFIVKFVCGGGGGRLTGRLVHHRCRLLNQLAKFTCQSALPSTPIDTSCVCWLRGGAQAGASCSLNTPQQQHHWTTESRWCVQVLYTKKHNLNEFQGTLKHWVLLLFTSWKHLSKKAFEELSDPFFAFWVYQICGYKEA